MAYAEYPDGPFVEVMKHANKNAVSNGVSADRLPFDTVDIGFAEFINEINMNKNQREIDIAYVTNFYHSAWKSLHITMAVLKETLNEQRKIECLTVYDAMTRLKMSHLLIEGLPKTVKNWLYSEND